MQLYHYFMSQSVSFAAITLCVVSQRVTDGKRIFHYDSVRKLLDTPSYRLYVCRATDGAHSVVC